MNEGGISYTSRKEEKNVKIARHTFLVHKPPIHYGGVAPAKRRKKKEINGCLQVCYLGSCFPPLLLC
jgi:hypothetical protein